MPCQKLFFNQNNLNEELLKETHSMIGSAIKNKCEGGGEKDLRVYFGVIYFWNCSSSDNPLDPYFTIVR